MRDILTRRNLFLLATTSVLGLGLAAIPVAIDLNTAHPVLKSAWAHGGEGGSGGEGGDGGDGGDGGEGGHGGDDGGESGDDGGESGENGHSDDDGGESGDDGGESGESGNSGPGSVNSHELEVNDDSRSRP